MDLSKMQYSISVDSWEHKQASVLKVCYNYLLRIDVSMDME